MLSEKESGVFAWQATKVQNSALREICNRWHDEFWSFDEILNTLRTREALLLFIGKRTSSHHWDGALLAGVGPESADLLYIFVDQKGRRHGLGKRLLQNLMERLQDRGIKTMFLEVRASNVSARTLYEGVGMKLVDRRKKYYSDGEDALIFQMLIGKQASQCSTKYLKKKK